MTRIQLYDTTLRDGMQGEGMSLSAQEKLRVAHRLDELGIDLIEAGFPSSNPKELELFELLERERFGHAEVAAFGMTRRRGVAADQDPALRVLADCFAPVCTLVGKTWRSSPGEGAEGRRRREPPDDRGVGGVPRGGGQAGRLRRRALLRRLRGRPGLRRAVPCRRGRGGRRDRRLLRHQRRHAPRSGGSGDGVRGRGGGIGWSPGGDPLPRRRRLRRRELPRRGPAGRHARPRDGERLRRAVRQRESRLDHPQPAAEARLRMPDERAARGAHARGAFPRRAPELHARPGSAVRRSQRVRPQGRDARRRDRRGSGHVRARRPGGRGQSARGADLRTLGQGNRSCAGPRGGDRTR